MPDTPITIPAGRNLMHDPRPVGATRLFFVGGATGPFVTDRSYSGTGSIFLTIPATGSATITAAVDDDSDLSALIGGTLNGVLHVSGVAATGMQAFFQVVYTDASVVNGSAVSIPITGTDFFRITLPTLALNAAKTVRNIWVTVYNPSGATKTLYVGGFDVRRNQAIDGFIHGSAGANYSWSGTANNSPSNRAAYTVGPVFGTGGQLIPSIKVHVVNRKNQILREITDHFVDGSINYDLDAEQWKGTCSLVLDEPGLITPLADEYARTTLRIDYPDGTFAEKSLGLFNMDAPTERWSSGHDTWTYEGKDILSILATWNIPGQHGDDLQVEPGSLIAGFILNPGWAYSAGIDVLLGAIGLSSAQYSFPGLTGTTSDYIVWEEGDSVLTMLTDVLNAAGWQSPWATPEGIITSAPAGLDPRDVAPSIVLATGQNSQVRWPFEVDPETSRVGNRIRVIGVKQVHQQTGWGDPQQVFDHWKRNKHAKKKKNRRDPVYKTVTPPVMGDVPTHADATASNLDPTHPLSFPRLGRWMDLPTVTLPAVENDVACAAIAAQKLYEASLIPVRVRLTTEVMARGLNEVYELDLSDAYGDPIPSGQGRYWCRGWTLQLGSPWEMVHNLTRVVGFDVASGF